MISLPGILFSASLEYLDHSGAVSMIMFLLIMGITAIITRKDREI